MTYICYVRTRSSDVDHMEVLPQEDLSKARAFAHAMLADRPLAVSAEIYAGDDLIERIERDAAA
ncbi:hypothetical protein [Brevundimonas sp.]|uniref:hypothetical protein n=1 Tax=Brevundimonas sp. TaxID=1871086 RepID=UPI0025F12CEE|nr:hypothetical protein [Brevundimonas sp.]